MSKYNPLVGPDPQKLAEHFGLTDDEIEAVVLGFLTKRGDEGATEDEINAVVTAVTKDAISARLTEEMIYGLVRGLVVVDVNEKGETIWGNHPQVNELLDAEFEKAWPPGQEIDIATGEKIDNNDST